MFQRLRNVNQQVWIAVASTVIIGVCAIPVFRKDLKPGHDIFSSDKPEVIRVAQEEKREEYRRRIAEQRKQIQKDKEALERKIKQQD